MSDKALNQDYGKAGFGGRLDFGKTPVCYTSILRAPTSTNRAGCMRVWRRRLKRPKRFWPKRARPAS